MALDYAAILNLPGGYWLAVLTLLGLAGEATVRIAEKWTVPALMVYVTVFGWYIMEPIVSPETMAFSSEAISDGYIGVFIFLVAFRILCTLLASMLAPRAHQSINTADIPAENILIFAVSLWLILLAFGTARMDGDLFTALFPLEARTGTTMWQRAAGADAGRFGFAVSIASYLYTLVLALFGMLLPILRKRSFQILCVILILISWPYAFLQGSRNIALAVFIPMIFSLLFFTRLRLPIKVSILLLSGVFIEWSMRQIINYRNVGFDYTGDVREQGHLGLNMASELVYCTSFIKTGVLQETWGLGILAELANFVPRFIWADKPLLGIDYAVARGFSGGDSDIGVVATISTGMIGQGVLEFGPYAGPIMSAALMALWAAWLTRLYAQGTGTRICLFLVGMGLTFNIGRNITLLVLWPMVFAFVLVLLLERYGKTRQLSPHRVAFDL